MPAINNPRRYLLIAIAISVLAVSGCLCALILTVRSTVAVIPAEIQATRTELASQIAALRDDSLGEIDEQANRLRVTAVNQLTVIRKDALAEAEAYRGTVETQLSGARVDLRSVISLPTIQALVAPLEGIRADLEPVLANAAAIEAHADEGVAVLARRDALPAQLLGLIAASKVTAGETAQTMKAIRDATPQFITTGQITNDQVAGVVTDIHTLTTKFTKPLTMKQKIWEGFKATAILIAHVI
jgi:hypothetical protein